MSEQHHEAPDAASPEATSSPRRPRRETEQASPAPVEALLGWREFQLVLPRRQSAAATVAAMVALRRWMQAQGHDMDGFYPVAQWQEYYTEAMRSTG